MAKQAGHLPLKGTIGNLTFYQMKGQHIVRKKGGIDARRMAADPSFERTRENAREFGAACKAGKLLRQAFAPLLLRFRDHTVTARLSGAMYRTLQTDMLSARGERKVEHGNVTLLQGFHFNGKAAGAAGFPLPYTVSVDRASGTAEVAFPALVPRHYFSRHGGATHYQLSLQVAELDFAAGTFRHSLAETGDLPLSREEQSPVALKGAFPPGSTQPLFLALCLSFHHLPADRRFVQDPLPEPVVQLVAADRFNYIG